MATFKLPLSGNVSQNIDPFSWFSDMTSGQFGMININLGQSSAPDVEQEILDNVGSYGRQLGRISAAMRVLVEKFPEEEKKKLSKEERKALNRFSYMMDDIDKIKEAARK